MICGHGGIGRRVRLRGVWETVRVQVPVTAPKEKSRNLSKDKCDFFAILSLKPKNMV